MNKIHVVLTLALIFCAASFSRAEADWTLEVFTGTAYSFNTPLTIHQDGEDDININSADYSTNPFSDSPYYSIRVGKWKGDKGWELELVHHKLYLENNPDEVEQFVISHGYNLCTVNRAWKYKGMVYHLGGGLVLAHPETIVRGKEQTWVDGTFNEGNKGFYFCGAAVQAAVGKRWPISKKGLFVELEAKITAAYAWVPIEDGMAEVPNVALHGLIGLGYDF